MEAFGIVLVVLTILLVAILFLGESGKQDEQNQKTTDNVLLSLTDFKPTAYVKGSTYEYFYFAVDDTRNKVFYYDPYRQREFFYEDIVSASLKIGNEVLVSKQSTSGSATPSLFGGYNVSSRTSSYSQTQVDSIIIHILLRNMSDSDSSQFDIVCHRGTLKQGTSVFNKYSSMANKIMDLLKLAIDKVETEWKVKNAQPTFIGVSIADEIRKLAELKKEGVISDTDFESAKGRLLANSNNLISDEGANG